MKIMHSKVCLTKGAFSYYHFPLTLHLSERWQIIYVSITHSYTLTEFKVECNNRLKEPGMLHAWTAQCIGARNS